MCSEATEEFSSGKFARGCWVGSRLFRMNEGCEGYESVSTSGRNVFAREVARHRGL